MSMVYSEPPAVNWTSQDFSSSPVKDDSKTHDCEKCKLTDVGNGERLAARYGGELRYCHPWRRWLVWDGRRWALDDTAASERMAKATVRMIYDEAAEVEDVERRRAVAKWAMASESSARIRAMLERAASEPGMQVTPQDTDRDPWAFNCLNGTVDLRTGELRPHRREHLISKLCRLDYEPDAECPLWLSTLDLFFDGDADLIGYWQRICGYAMAGVIRDHVLPVAYGRGSNGKSTILGTLMDVLGPDYAMKAPPDLLMAKRQDGHPTDRADLHGKRLVVAIESEEGRRLNETLVKELTGGDTIRARRMREDFWEFKPTHTLIMATNHKPEIRGTDKGIWRRLRLVPFVVAVDDKQADRAMPEKLRAEHAGILAWCVRGCLEWQRMGLEPPEAVAKATAEYQSEEDVLGAFLAEHCLTSDDVRARASDLYERYKRHMEASGETTVSQTRFGKAMGERGFQKAHSGGTWYLGIGLRPANPTL